MGRVLTNSLTFLGASEILCKPLNRSKIELLSLEVIFMGRRNDSS